MGTFYSFVMPGLIRHPDVLTLCLGLKAPNGNTQDESFSSNKIEPAGIFCSINEKVVVKEFHT